MKKLFVTTFSFFLLFSMQSCLEDQCTDISTYYIFEPVYLSEEQLRQEIMLENARALKNPGKMYFYQNMIFISEKYEGVHIYNNTDPSAPDKIGFLPIPGNQDISIKNDVLYADALIDILTIDISNIQSPSLIQRTEDVIFAQQNGENQYVAYYEKVEVRNEYDCSGGVSISEGWLAFDDASLANVEVISNTGVPSGASQVGVGGSTARMRIVNNHMYVVDQTSLKSFDISVDGFPSIQSEQNLGWGIETIYPYEDKLFIGSETGMFIFDNSNPASPEYLSEFRHWRSCDPVVVEGETAYVTLRDGNQCAGFINQLDVIDISNVLEPELIKTFDMTNPHGLAIRDNRLFICEGTDGLKIYDASDSENIDENLLHHNRGFHAFDVISLNENLAFIIGEDGFFQYNMSNPSEPQLLSSILIER